MAPMLLYASVLLAFAVPLADAKTRQQWLGKPEFCTLVTSCTADQCQTEVSQMVTILPTCIAELVKSIGTWIIRGECDGAKLTVQCLGKYR